MQRRSLFFGALGATIAGAAAATPQRGVMVIYVHADDCAPCHVFTSQDWPQWQASPLSRSVTFIMTRAPKSTQAYQSRYWPSVAMPYLHTVPVPIVPAFVLVNNGMALLVGIGLNGWRNQVLPQARRLLEAGV